MDELNKLNVQQLRDILKSKSLAISGAKKILIKRILDNENNSNVIQMDLVNEEVVRNSTESGSSFENRMADIVTKERELILRERSLIEREQRINVDREGNPDISCQLGYREIIELLPEFNPGNEDSLNAMQWIERINLLKTGYKWTDGVVLASVVFKLKGTAKLWFDSLKTLHGNWTEFSEDLHAFFRSEHNEADYHLSMQQRKQHVNESAQNYVMIMNRMGKNANFSDEAIIRYIINGLSSSNLQNLLKISCFKTITELLTAIKCFNNFSILDKNLNIAQSNKRYQNQSKPIPKLVSCAICKRKNHESRNCWFKNKFKPETKCYSCNKFGHIAKNCTTPKQANFTTKSNQFVKEICFNNYTKIRGLVDTGCTLNLIQESPLNTIAAENVKQHYKLKLSGLANSEVETIDKVKLKFQIDSNTYSSTFYSVPDNSISYQLILGAEFINSVSITMNKSIMTILPSLEEQFEVLNISTIDNYELNIKTINPDNVTSINSMFIEYQRTSRKLSSSPIKLNLVLTDEKPVFQPPRRISFADKDLVDEQISIWLKEGIIRESVSNYASPIVLVNKKDGTKRLCIDYRALNTKIIRDRQPMPLIEEQIDQLGDYKYFSTIDLKNGFFHVPIEESSKHYTSFITHDGQYEFNRAPFGLSTSPTIFLRYIQYIFKDVIKQKICRTYMDDILIPGKTEEEAMNNLKSVLKLAADFNLEINWKKCVFLAQEIEYLGYIITNGTIRPSNNKTEAVRNFPQIKTIKQVESFLGLTGYFRKFIPNYSIIAKPLSDLKKKNMVFKIGQEQEVAIANLKNILCNQPVLNIYKLGADLELHTDASKFGLAAILFQKNDLNELHPIYYWSKKTSDIEQRYTSYELEVSAVVQAIKKFRIYLENVNFKIVTDCNAFQQSINKKDIISSRVNKWAIVLSNFNYTVEHRKNQSMKHVDSLSRNIMLVEINEGLIGKIKLTQRNDQHLKSIISKLNRNEVIDNYVLRNDILYLQKNGIDLLVVPKTLENQVIKCAHEDGHFGVQKMQELIQRNYFIPNLNDKLQEYKNVCIKCILIDRKNGKKEGFLHSIDKGDIPMDTLHIDHVGPVTATSKLYKHILVVIDGFSKYVWLYPTKSTSSKETIDKLKLQIINFGTPKRLISDRGTSFTSNDFSEFVKSCNINHVLIPIGLPRANGQVERINRIIIPSLAKLSIENPDQWYKWVGKVQIAINSTFQRCINCTPYELLFGTQMRTNNDLDEIKATLQDELIENFKNKRMDLRKRAADKIKEIQQTNEMYYNKKRKIENTYKIGDIVAVQRSQYTSGSKLIPKYLGPYKIFNKKGFHYEVRKIGGKGPLKTTATADQMKIW